MGEATLEGGLIGCGFFARNHLHAWRDLAHEGVELVAVCDLDEARAAKAAAEFGVPRHYTDADSMLEAERPDFVDVVTTPESHRALVELAAARGVPVVVQKPFAPALADCRAMVDACRRAGVPLMVHENFRFQTPIMAVREVLERGTIGRPFFARISWRTAHDVFAGQPYLAKAERLLLLDVGVHLLDVARYLFGEVDRVTCRTARIRPDIAGEDAATVLLAHHEGTTTVVDATYGARLDPDPFPETLIEVDGAVGTIRLGPGYELTVVGPDGTERRDVPPRAPSWAGAPWQAVQESVLNAQRHWVECLRTGREPATSGADNLETFALVEAAYASAARRATVFTPV